MMHYLPPLTTGPISLTRSLPYGYLTLPTLYGYRTLTFDSDYALLNSDYHRFTF